MKTQPAQAQAAEKAARITQIEAAIAGISEELKRPMSNLERSLLVADRRDFREELAKILLTQ